MQRLHIFIPVAVASVLLPLAVACGGNDDKKEVTVAVPTTSAAQTQAKTQFCTELVSLKTAATQVQSLNANSSVDDAKKAQLTLRASWEKVKLSAKSVNNVKIDELEKAQTTLDKAMDSIPPGATISSAAAQIGPQAQAVLQAQANVHTATPCPSS